ncbi:TOMM precursor leader peptide-binding protein [Paenibacillus senegalensis]|uniref:TOMM precursor leader peptide-binding protein n=1 Tax=Paenibacillus senegalensis TaxID=1465766 RepID=UPI000287EDDA|nr:TOMM precursor leader peptide-binding protein [Paenibacillus senegalensis]
MNRPGSTVMLAVIGEGQLTGMITDLAASESWLSNSLQVKLVKLPSLPSHSEWPQLQEADLILWIQEDETAHIPSQEVELKLKKLRSSPWLCASYTTATGFVGPWVQSDLPGCFQCSATRRIIADVKAVPMIDFAKLLRPENGPEDVEPQEKLSAVNPGALSHMAQLLTAELRRFIQGITPNTAGAYYEVDINTLAARLHRFLPDPTCPVCSQLEQDSAENALPPLVQQPKPSTDNFRTRPLAELLPFIKKDYVDAKSGIFTELTWEHLPPFPVVTARLPQLTTEAEYSAGRSHSYLNSEGTAVLEGLERYCGIAPKGKVSHIYASYESLKDDAIDPRRFGLYMDDQYNQPDFPYRPFDAAVPTNWVWGYSLTENRPVLLPESIAYYSAGYADSFVEETSNGCSLGGSLSEAILHGMLEVIERDSFLLAWYRKLLLPPIDPDSAAGSELQWMRSRLRHIYGYELHLFNMTMDSGIPAIWVILRSRKEHDARLINAAAAHPDPEQAAINALHEAAAFIPVLNAKFRERRKETELMVHDASLVRQMDDHPLVYAHPKAESRLDFLLKNNREPQTFQEVAEMASLRALPSLSHTDLTADVQELVERFRSLNLEVLVVNQTCSEIEKNQLCCVKVLIPGMLPMSFGHHLRRLNGLYRLASVPDLLGYPTELSSPNELNLHPHPFP